MQLVTEQEVLMRFEVDNPWWESFEIEERFSKLPYRTYFNHFYELVQERSLQRAVILMGPRRVGKTVMVYQAIQELIRDGIQSNTILYISLETPIYIGMSLEQLVNKYVKFNNHNKDSELTIFFDEIQYHKDWEVHLKSLVDTYPNYKFVATGSAAAALRLKSQESGAGRFTDFLLPPLTFAEFLNFIGREDELLKVTEDNYIEDIDALNEEFINYLNYGGYPEAVFSEIVRTESYRYIKSDIIDKVLLRDLPSLYGITDIQELNRLFTVIAYNTGNEVSYKKLSQSSGVVINTLKRYLEYLEAAFLIKKVRRIDENAKQFKRETAFKIYLTNPSMRAALFSPISANDDAMGNVVETAVFSQLLHSSSLDNNYYARWGKSEVDLVKVNPKNQKPRSVIEVKWSDKPISDRSKIKGLLEFTGKHTIDSIFLTSRSIETELETKGTKINVIPSSVLTYALGKTLLDNLNQIIKSKTKIK